MEGKEEKEERRRKGYGEKRKRVVLERKKECRCGKKEGRIIGL